MLITELLTLQVKCLSMYQTAAGSPGIPVQVVPYMHELLKVYLQSTCPVPNGCFGIPESPADDLATSTALTVENK